MILLVTPAQRAPECAIVLEQVTGEPVTVARSLLEATTQLRTSLFTIAIFDHHLIETEPNETDTAYAHLGDAAFLNVNFALTGMDRLIREVRTARTRRQRTQAAALSAATLSLKSTLNDSLTTLLLHSKLAANMPNLAPDAIERLTAIHESIEKLSSHVGPSDNSSSSIHESSPN